MNTPIHYGPANTTRFDLAGPNHLKNGSTKAIERDPPCTGGKQFYPPVPRAILRPSQPVARECEAGLDALTLDAGEAFVRLSMHGHEGQSSPAPTRGV